MSTASNTEPADSVGLAICFESEYRWIYPLGLEAAWGSFRRFLRIVNNQHARKRLGKILAQPIGATQYPSLRHL
jgi:hypothetical protein